MVITSNTTDSDAINVVSDTDIPQEIAMKHLCSDTRQYLQIYQFQFIYVTSV